MVLVCAQVPREMREEKFGLWKGVIKNFTATVTNLKFGTRLMKWKWTIFVVPLKTGLLISGAEGV